MRYTSFFFKYSLQRDRRNRGDASRTLDPLVTANQVTNYKNGRRKRRALLAAAYRNIFLDRRAFNKSRCKNTADNRLIRATPSMLLNRRQKWMDYVSGAAAAAAADLEYPIDQEGICIPEGRSKKETCERSPAIILHRQTLPCIL